jgi:hypothetical protein
MAGALDPSTRAMSVEILLPNPDAKLLPGAYAEISLNITQTKALTVPPNTLVFRPDGPKVAVVDAQQHIALHSVKLGRDFGKAVEVLSGVEASDRLELNPPDALEDGLQVRVQAPSKPHS